MKWLLRCVFSMTVCLSFATTARTNNRKSIEDLFKQEKSLNIHADAATREARLAIESILSSAKNMDEVASFRKSAYDSLNKSKELRMQAINLRHKQETMKSRLSADDRLRQSVEIDNLRLSEDKKIEILSDKISTNYSQAYEYLDPSRVKLRELQEKTRNLEIEFANSKAESEDRVYKEGAVLRELQLEKIRQSR